MSKPCIEIFSAFGDARITVSDGKYSVGLLVNPTGIRKIIAELQSVLCDHAVAELQDALDDVSRDGPDSHE